MDLLKLNGPATARMEVTALVGARIEIGLLIWSSFMAILLLSWPSIYCQIGADLTYSHLTYIYILHSFCYI